MEAFTVSLVLLSLALWLLATLVKATPLGDALLSRLGALGTFVPAWNFFAPHPGIHDFHLLTRERLYNGEMTAWRQDMLFERTRGLLACIWNPHKIERKMLSDIAVSLAGEVASAGEDIFLVKLSLPYLILASYATTRPHSSATEGVQFMLMRSSAIQPEGDVLFVSEVHPLE